MNEGLREMGSHKTYGGGERSSRRKGYRTIIPTMLTHPHPVLRIFFVVTSNILFTPHLKLSPQTHEFEPEAAEYINRFFRFTFLSASWEFLKRGRWRYSCSINIRTHYDKTYVLSLARINVNDTFTTVGV